KVSWFHFEFSSARGSQRNKEADGRGIQLLFCMRRNRGRVSRYSCAESRLMLVTPLTRFAVGVGIPLMKSFVCALAIALLPLTAIAGELQDAARLGDVEKVRALITANPGAINARVSATTALHEA